MTSLIENVMMIIWKLDLCGSQPRRAVHFAGVTFECLPPCKRGKFESKIMSGEKRLSLKIAVQGHRFGPPPLSGPHATEKCEHIGLCVIRSGCDSPSWDESITN